MIEKISTLTTSSVWEFLIKKERTVKKFTNSVRTLLNSIIWVQTLGLRLQNDTIGLSKIY